MTSSNLDRDTPQHFTEQITKLRQSPLLELPGDDLAYGKFALPMLPMRSKWIAM